MASAELTQSASHAYKLPVEQGPRERAPAAVGDPS